MAAGARINRLLRPTTLAARYGKGGRVYSIEELVSMLKAPEEKGEGRPEAEATIDRDEVLKALALRLWETHQRGYVAWHFQTPRYRTYELFDWVRDMMGGEDASAKWLTSWFLSDMN